MRLFGENESDLPNLGKVQESLDAIGDILQHTLQAIGEYLVGMASMMEAGTVKADRTIKNHLRKQLRRMDTGIGVVSNQIGQYVVNGLAEQQLAINRAAGSLLSSKEAGKMGWAVAPQPQAGVPPNGISVGTFAPISGADTLPSTPPLGGMVASLPQPAVTEPKLPSVPLPPDAGCTNYSHPFNPCCPADTETLTGKPPQVDLPAGFCWGPKGSGPKGGILWTCIPCPDDGGTVGGDGGGGGIGVGQGPIGGGGIVNPPQPQCPVGYQIIRSDVAGDWQAAGRSPGQVADCQVVGQDPALNRVYFCCPVYPTGPGVGIGGVGPPGGGVVVGPPVGGNGGPPPPPPEPQPAKPCELPDDVKEWTGHRVVLLPYDLSTEGEKSVLSECGRLMVNDAMSKVFPVTPLIDALNSDDWLKTLLPEAFETGGDYPEREEPLGFTGE